MSKLKRSLISILKHNRDGSYATRAAREGRLLYAIRALEVRNPLLKNIHSIKTKHIDQLIHLWKSQTISIGTD